MTRSFTLPPVLVSFRDGMLLFLGLDVEIARPTDSCLAFAEVGSCLNGLLAANFACEAHHSPLMTYSILWIRGFSWDNGADTSS